MRSLTRMHTNHMHVSCTIWPALCVHTHKKKKKLQETCATVHPSRIRQNPLIKLYLCGWGRMGVYCVVCSSQPETHHTLRANLKQGVYPPQACNQLAETSVCG